MRAACCVQRVCALWRTTWNDGVFQCIGTVTGVCSGCAVVSRGHREARLAEYGSTSSLCLELESLPDSDPRQTPRAGGASIRRTRSGGGNGLSPLAA